MRKRIASILTALVMLAVPFTQITWADDEPAADDPTYRVFVTRGDTSGEYTAAVTLENIAATYGAFGLKYDKSVFEFIGAERDEGSPALLFTPYTMYGGETEVSDTNGDGFYVFVWQSSPNDASEFNALEEKPIVNLKFTLTGSEDDITLDSFTVMPWNKTKEAIAFAKTLPTDNPEFEPKEYYSEYWRYTDAANDALEVGRLSRDKAIIHGIDTGGFHQASVNAEAGENITDASYFYDVRTIIDYDDSIDVKKSVIKFHVTDKDTGDDIEDVFINLYEENALHRGEKTTDYMGEAVYATDITQSGAYAYTASKKGYWPVPESGFNEDRATFRTTAGESTLVPVELEKKIYHIPRTTDEHAVVGGEKYGYNGRPYNFRIEAEPGWRITSYPTTATVKIGDETWENLPVDTDTGLFTLTADKLHQAPLYDAPDDIGWQSDDIIIDFSDFTVEEITYEVTAYTNAGGIVAYDPQGGLPAVGGDHAKKITTTAASRKTGTFTFTPAQEGYVVEKVYINGLQIHTYDGQSTFSYSFGNVETDCNITVLYWDGTNPSDDAVMTIVVGDYGYASVTLPTESPPPKLRNTRKTYLNPTTALKFTAIAMDGYTLASIELSENGDARVEQEIRPDDASYSYVFEPPDKGGDKTVYVTFREENAAKTPTVFVKAYVRTGQGEIDPCGILIYDVHDTPTFAIKAEEEDGDWYTKGVYVSPFEDTENGREYDYPTRTKTAGYTLLPLEEDTAVGAIFTEKGYRLHGKVDLGQGSALGGNVLTGAAVTFTRTNAGGNVIPDAAEYKTRTTALRNDAEFAIDDLPAGTWTVTVTKPGYVKYIITKFTLDRPENDDDITEFGEKDGEVRKITPYIGSVRTGTSVTLLDAALIKAELRDGAVQSRGDVNDDGRVDAVDMAYVMFNYGKRTVTETYEEFLTSPQPETP